MFDLDNDRLSIMGGQDLSDADPDKDVADTDDTPKGAGEIKVYHLPEDVQ